MDPYSCRGPFPSGPGVSLTDPFLWVVGAEFGQVAQVRFVSAHLVVADVPVTLREQASLRSTSHLFHRGSRRKTHIALGTPSPQGAYHQGMDKEVLILILSAPNYDAKPTLRPLRQRLWGNRPKSHSHPRAAEVRILALRDISAYHNG